MTKNSPWIYSKVIQKRASIEINLGFIQLHMCSPEGITDSPVFFFPYFIKDVPALDTLKLPLLEIPYCIAGPSLKPVQSRKKN